MGKQFFDIVAPSPLDELGIAAQENTIGIILLLVGILTAAVVVINVFVIRRKKKDEEQDSADAEQE